MRISIVLSALSVGHILLTGCAVKATVSTGPKFTPLTGPIGTLVTLEGVDPSAVQSISIGTSNPILMNPSLTNGIQAYVGPGTTSGMVSAQSSGVLPLNGLGEYLVTSITSFPINQQGSNLVGTGSVGSSFQGYSVALSADGNTALLGGYADNSNVGAAWVFVRSFGVWTQQGNKLVGTGSVGSAKQGYSVALSADGNTALLGGPSDNAALGAAWVFIRSGTTWIQQTKLVGSGASGSSGQGIAVSLSANGNIALVGGNMDSPVGAAWAYSRNSAGTWTQMGSKLVGTGSSSGTGCAQGQSVALSGDGNTALIGAPVDASAMGSAWIFTQSSGNWLQQGAKIVPTENVGNAGFGVASSLSADGNTALIGGSTDSTNVGAAWVFTRTEGVWTSQGKFVGTNYIGSATQGLGVSMSADGTVALVGGPGDNNFTGAFWYFSLTNGIWSQSGTKISAPGTGTQNKAGQGIVLSADGSTTVVGAYNQNMSFVYSQ